MNLIYSEGKIGLENCSAYFILYLLATLLMNIHCFGDGGLGLGFFGFGIFLFFLHFNRKKTKGNNKNDHRRYGTIALFRLV